MWKLRKPAIFLFIALHIFSAFWGAVLRPQRYPNPRLGENFDTGLTWMSSIDQTLLDWKWGNPTGGWRKFLRDYTYWTAGAQNWMLFTQTRATPVLVSVHVLSPEDQSHGKSPRDADPIYDSENESNFRKLKQSMDIMASSNRAYALRAFGNYWVWQYSRRTGKPWTEFEIFRRLPKEAKQKWISVYREKRS